MKIYPILVESCAECPNCRVTIDSDLSIWGYYCLALKDRIDVSVNRNDGTTHPKCPLGDVTQIKE